MLPPKSSTHSDLMETTHMNDLMNWMVGILVPMNAKVHSFLFSKIATLPSGIVKTVSNRISSAKSSKDLYETHSLKSYDGVDDVV